MSQRLKKISLLFGDIIFLYLALWLTLVVRHQALPSLDRIEQHLGPFTIVYAVWLVVFYITGLYTININQNDVKFYLNLGKAMTWNAALGAAFFYLTPFVSISPKTNFLINLILSALLITLWRQGINRVIGSKTLQTNTLIIGESTQVNELVNELHAKPQLGYRVVKILSPSNVMNDVDFRLHHVIDSYQVKVIAAEPISLRSQTLVDQLFKILPLKLRVVDLANFSEEVSGKIPVNAIGQAWFLENLSLGSQRTYEALKRGFDIAAALLLFILTIWLTPIITLAIKLGSQGPIFFKQTRTGLLEKPFLAVKFRSMIHDPKTLQPDYTQPDDPRITAIGKILRKTRLDEIPQLWNVLKGDLSFVGPRPERPEYVAELKRKIPFYGERHLVKPGLTGWDQISGTYHSPSLEDTMAKLQYDLYYIKNRSFLFDLAIILKTIKTILSRSGT